MRSPSRKAIGLEMGSAVVADMADRRSFGFAIFKFGLTMSTGAARLFHTRPSDQLGVPYDTAAAEMGSDRKVVNGANGGGRVLLHLRILLPHFFKFPLRATG